MSTAPSSSPPPSTNAEDQRQRPRRVRRGPILLVVVVALVAAVIAQSRAPSSSSAVVVTANADVGVPASDVASSAWYCAAGTSSPGGVADETVVIASLARTDIDATVSVMPGGDASVGTRRVHLAPGGQTSVRVADVLATAEPGVVVETLGGAAAVTHVVSHGDDIGVEPCSRQARRDWYFASGTTVDGAQHLLALFNPFGDDAIVDVSFLTDTGEQQPAALQAMVVPRHSRITVPVQDAVLRQDRIATSIRSRSGRIVAEQLQVFDDTTVADVPLDGIALSLGAPAPARAWTVAAGSTDDGGAGTLELANFTDTEAAVDVEVVVVGGEKLPAQRVKIPRQSLRDVAVTNRVALGAAYAVVVTSRDDDGRRVPVVAELFSSWAPASATTGVAGMLGSTVSSTRWVVPRAAVGASGVLTIYNPGPDPVTAAALPASLADRRIGATSEPEVAIPPGQARTIRLAAAGGSLDPIVVTATHAVVVGLTELGAAGAAVSSAIPDLARAG